MSNHSNSPDPEMHAALRKALGDKFRQENIGPTGNFQEGKLTKRDDGEIAFAVGQKDGKVMIEFGTPTAWIGFSPQQAISLGQLLIRRGRSILEFDVP